MLAGVAVPGPPPHAEETSAGKALSASARRRVCRLIIPGSRTETRPPSRAVERGSVPGTVIRLQGFAGGHGVVVTRDLPKVETTGSSPVARSDDEY